MKKGKNLCLSYKTESIVYRQKSQSHDVDQNFFFAFIQISKSTARLLKNKMIMQNRNLRPPNVKYV